MGASNSPAAVRKRRYRAKRKALGLPEWKRPNRFVNNKDKTHCKRGHEFTEANTFWAKSGHRQRVCRTCKRDAAKKARAAQPKKRPPCAHGLPTLSACPECFKERKREQRRAYEKSPKGRAKKYARARRAYKRKRIVFIGRERALELAIANATCATLVLPQSHAS